MTSVYITVMRAGRNFFVFRILYGSDRKVVIL